MEKKGNNWGHHANPSHVGLRAFFSQEIIGERESPMSYPSMCEPAAQRSGQQHLDSFRQPPAGQNDLSLCGRAGSLDVLLADFLNIFGNLAV
jgi:hypothetical protein